MDGVLLVAILVPLIIAVFNFLLFSAEGSKGIVKEPYRSKSGKTHTAKKSREQYIV